MRRRVTGRKLGWLAGIAALLFWGVTGFGPSAAAPGADGQTVPVLTDHFDGDHFFNPGDEPPPEGQAPRRSRWLWRWLLRDGMPEWPAAVDVSPAPPPPSRVPAGALQVTAVGHATFLVQMEGLNVLIDPIWSDRCSPVSWAGPRRRQAPGLRFEELPPIDVVLVTHNHYDHLDLPTLERLASRGVARAVTPLGNGALIRGAGIAAVDELDWWGSLRLTPAVTLTLVPARHFSSRTLWDRNRALWGGFVLSGPAGHVYHAGDTAYGPHFRQIAARFAPLRLAMLPIAPFRPRQPDGAPAAPPSQVHMGPAEAVQAHLDLGAQRSMAAHFQVFQLGFEGFDDATADLALALQEREVSPAVFVAPKPGQVIAVPGAPPAGALAGGRAGPGGPPRPS